MDAESDRRVFRDEITAKFDPTSNDRVIVVMDLDIQAGIRSLYHCLEQSMNFKKSDFDVKSSGRDGGRTHTPVVFRKSSLAKEALDKFESKIIQGKHVRVIRKDHPSSIGLAGSLDTKRTAENAARRGPIIIDGSTLD